MPTESTNRRLNLWFAAAAFLTLLTFGHQVWRAFSQPISPDEALTYTNWVSQPWSALDEGYYVNNHVLATVLAKVSNDAFGSSEFSLRIPALLGCVVFFLLSFRFCDVGERFGSLQFFGVIFLVSNPFVLDFLCCARGYGPGIASLACCLFIMTKILERRARGRLSLFLLGLTLALVPLFMLAFSLAALALGLVFLICFLIIRRDEGTPFGKTLLDVATFTVSPALIAVAAVLLPIMRNANKDLFYYGTTGWAATRDGLAALWLRHIDREDHPIVADNFFDQAVDTYGGTLLVCLAAFVTFAALITATGFLLRKRSEPMSRQVILVTLSSLGFCLTMALQSFVHQVFDLPLPRVRTALHLVFLASLAGVATWIWFWNMRSWWRLLAGVLTMVLASILVCQLSVSAADEYAEWTWDSGCRRVFRKLESLNAGGARLNVVSVPSRFTASQKYYRRLEKADWLHVVGHDPQDTTTQFDYILLAKSLLHDPRVTPVLNEVVYSDPESDCLIVRLKRR